MLFYSSLKVLCSWGISHSFRGYALSSEMTEDDLQFILNLSSTSVLFKTLASWTLFIYGMISDWLNLSMYFYWLSLGVAIFI